MTQCIDFLPDHYHEIQKRRQKRVFRRAALAMFLILVFVGMLEQWRQRRVIQGQIDRVAGRIGDIDRQLGTSAEVQQEIEELDRRSDLVASFRVQVATTRLLAALNECRPPHVSLAEVRMSHERVRQKAEAETGKPPARRDKQKAAPSLKQRLVNELQQLRERRLQHELVIRIQGMAPDHLAVSEYMASLDQTGFFLEVRLVENEEVEVFGMPHQRFRCQLTVRSPSAATGSETEVTELERIATIPAGGDRWLPDTQGVWR